MSQYAALVGRSRKHTNDELSHNHQHQVLQLPVVVAPSNSLCDRIWAWAVTVFASRNKAQSLCLLALGTRLCFASVFMKKVGISFC